MSPQHAVFFFTAPRLGTKQPRQTAEVRAWICKQSTYWTWYVDHIRPIGAMVELDNYIPVLGDSHQSIHRGSYTHEKEFLIMVRWPIWLCLQMQYRSNLQFLAMPCACMPLLEHNCRREHLATANVCTPSMCIYNYIYIYIYIHTVYIFIWYIIHTCSYIIFHCVQVIGQQTHRVYFAKHFLYITCLSTLSWQDHKMYLD